MGKGKPAFNILMVKMQSQANRRTFAIITVITLSALLLYYNFRGKNIPKKQFTFSNDEILVQTQVKIIPAQLSDEAIDSLPKSSFSYLTMIDAGSSGCRAHVYRYGTLGSSDGPLYILPMHNSKKVKPGLSSFASKELEAGESLLGLIEFLKSEIPEEEWPNTPIWLKATAGLRMLDKEKSDKILDSVRKFLGDRTITPFLFRPSWAKIIPGNEEGAFGWIAVNYLYKVIGPKKKTNLLPYAVVEMGGASTQVTQLAPTKKEADAIPSAFKFSFTIQKELFTLYTHSYLGYGGEQAREALNNALIRPHLKGGKDFLFIGSTSSSNINSETKGDGIVGNNSSDILIHDPCINSGYTRSKLQPRKEVYEGPELAANILGASSSKSNNCTELAEKVLFSLKGHSSCESPAPHSFNCVHQPDFLINSKNFLVFENFYYIAAGTGILPAGHDTSLTSSTHKIDTKESFPLKTSPREYVDAAIEVCNHKWSDLQKQFPRDDQPKDVNIKLCFTASYTAAFLLQGLGLPMDKVITVQKEVGGSDIEWALGAAYLEAAEFLHKK